jgi:hypothetical protein
MDNFTMSDYDEQCLKKKSIHSYEVFASCDVEFKFDLRERKISSIKEF